MAYARLCVLRSRHLTQQGTIPNGSLRPRERFVVARIRNAGICGVYPSKAGADTLIAKLQGEQARIGGYIDHAEPANSARQKAHSKM